MRRASLALLALAASLSACVPAGEAADAGYVAGDGTVTEWLPGDRGEVIELTGVDFAGEAVDLADYRGTVVLVNTWYAACPPCRAEAPDLVAADARPDVQVLGVNGEDDAGTAQAFERNFGVEYPSIADGDRLALATLQGIVPLNAVPTTLVLDPEGRIAARVIGRIDPSTLDALIAAAALT